MVHSLYWNAITKTPVISHSVGIAPEILTESLIIDNKITSKPNLEFAYNSVLELTIPQGINRFDKLFKKMKVSIGTNIKDALGWR